MILQFFNLFTFVGTVFSSIIAVQMLRMDNLTFVNKLFLIYFIIDSVHGHLLGYFSFKLMERFGIWFELVADMTSINFSTESKQSQNCGKFIGIWMNGIPMKSLTISVYALLCLMKSQPTR